MVPLAAAATLTVTTTVKSSERAQELFYSTESLNNRVRDDELCFK